MGQAASTPLAGYELPDEAQVVEEAPEGSARAAKKQKTSEHIAATLLPVRTLADFPADVLTHIATKLTCMKDRLNLASICKSTHAALEESKAWETMEITLDPRTTAIKQSAITWCKKHGPAFKSLKIKIHVDTLDRTTVTHLIPTASNLEELSVSGDNVCVASLSYIATCMPKLRKFHFNGARIMLDNKLGDQAVFLQELSVHVTSSDGIMYSPRLRDKWAPAGLTKLELLCDDFPQHREPQFHLQSCSNLKSLAVRTVGVGVLGQEAVFLNCFSRIAQQLTYLSLADSHLHAIPAALSTLTSLQTLNLDGNHLSSSLADESFKYLRPLNDLTALHLARCRMQGPLPEDFSALTSLQALDLNSNGNSDIDALGHLSELTALNISHQHELEEDEVHCGTIFAECTNLQRLWMNGTSMSVGQVRDEMPKVVLASLRVWHIDSSQAALGSFYRKVLERFEGLREIHIVPDFCMVDGDNMELPSAYFFEACGNATQLTRVVMEVFGNYHPEVPQYAEALKAMWELGRKRPDLEFEIRLPDDMAKFDEKIV